MNTDLRRITVTVHKDDVKALRASVKLANTLRGINVYPTERKARINVVKRRERTEEGKEADRKMAHITAVRMSGNIELEKALWAQYFPPKPERIRRPKTEPKKTQFGSPERDYLIDLKNRLHSDRLKAMEKLRKKGDEAGYLRLGREYGFW